jgi:hypothetical protein
MSGLGIAGWVVAGIVILVGSNMFFFLLGAAMNEDLNKKKRGGKSK